MDDIAFGRLVKLARIKRGWRQQDLAERAGVSRSVLSRIERGHIAETSLGTVRAIAQRLDLRIELNARARAMEWNASTVSACLLVADSMTNRRRIRERTASFHAALPDDGRALRRWLHRPL